MFCANSLHLSVATLLLARGVLAADGLCGYECDTKWPRIRAAWEREDPSVCKLRKDDCTAMARGESQNGVEGQTVWRNLWAAAAAAAADPAILADQPWLEACTTSGTCIYCADVYEDVQNTPATAPNLDWRDAVTPADPALTIAERWAAALTNVNGRQVLKCAQPDNPDNLCSDALSTGGGMPARNEAGTGWADMISNYTSYRDMEFRRSQARCEMAIVRDAQEASRITGRLADAGTYRADAEACLSGPDFSFSYAFDERSTGCLSYFVGYYEDMCNREGPTCQDMFYGTGGVSAAEADAHVSYFVEKAYEIGGTPDSGSARSGQSSSACDVPDVVCKTKLCCCGGVLCPGADDDTSSCTFGGEGDCDTCTSSTVLAVAVTATVLVVLGCGIGFALKNPAVREKLNLSTKPTSTGPTTTDAPTEIKEEDAIASPPARPTIAQRPAVEATESPLDQASANEI